LGWVSAVDSEGRTIFIVDAHRDGQHFIVRAEEKLTAFIEVESAAGNQIQQRQNEQGSQKSTLD